ncbi:MAG TPA: hypothetical protein VFX35_00865 [Solirubrobacterales bacterium]|nr:hypothetical protein [Solirubrobacterales bacterium]
MSWRLTFLAAVAIVAIAGVAIAAQGGGSKNVVLCADKQGGDLSLAAKGRCGKGQRKLVISKQGPQGTQGPKGEQGVPGASGAPGTTASIQPEPVHLVGAAVPAGCEAVPGTFCSSGAAGWMNHGTLSAPAGYWIDAAGEVHLTGTIKATASGPVTDLFYLPAGYRPNGIREFVVPTCELESMKLEVEPSGAVHTPFVPPENCLALDEVSFRP